MKTCVQHRDKPNHLLVKARRREDLDGIIEWLNKQADNRALGKQNCQS